MGKIVIDANVLISAAFGGIPLEAASKAFSIGKVYLSPDIVREVEETVHRLTPKLGKEKAKVLLALWNRFHSLCKFHKPAQKVVVCRDPKDDAYLSLCAGVMADFLVTGDKDLLAVDPAVTQGLSLKSNSENAQIFWHKKNNKVDQHECKSERYTNLDHSLLVIRILHTAIILGMLPGISIPPDSNNPINALFIWIRLSWGPISAAASVALSRTAETILTQIRPSDGILIIY